MYPKYMKSVNPDGNTTSLICQESEDKIILLQPVASANRQGYEVNITQVVSNDELKARIGGQVFSCSDDEYNETLFDTWGFDGSNIYRAKGDAGDNSTANDGSAPQVEGEQQSGDAGINTDASGSSDNGLGSVTDIQADTNPEIEGRSGSSDDANEQPSNSDAVHNEGNEAVGEGPGTSGDEPQPIAGTSDGDPATANDGNGDPATSENEDKTTA